MSDQRVLVAGEALVDFIPDSPGPLSSVDSFSPRPGGAPANVAVALARLGETPWFWTRVGADPFGDAVADALDAAGVPDRFVERDPEARTALAFVAHDGDADREFTFYRDGAADTRMEPGAVPEEALASVDHVAVGGVALSTEPSRTATLALARRAREHGCTVWFDPNARPELWDGGFPDAVEAALDCADVVKATPGDLAAAGVEGDPADLAAAVHDAGPHTLLLTLGAQGAYASATDAAPWGPAVAEDAGYDVAAVDTTGAGDAFTAGALAALADGDSLSDALAFADAVAALATTGEGAMAALPDRNAVEELRDER